MKQIDTYLPLFLESLVFLEKELNLKNYEMPHGGGILHAQIFVAEGETLKFKHSYAF